MAGRLDIVGKIRLCSIKLPEWGGGMSNKYNIKLQNCRMNLRKLISRRDIRGIQRYNEIRGVLPTTKALRLKHVNVQRLCSWCRLHNEDTMHVLFKCCFAKEVWQKAGLQGLFSVGDENTVLHALWVRRNSWVWNMKSMPIFGVTSIATNLLQDWERSQKIQKSERSGVLMKRWCKPPPEWVKINVDAACREDTEYIDAGCIVPDEHGQFFRGRAGKVRKCLAAREAEALSLHEALL
ncbi:uncharacterized protein LOC141674944 [Apium graveolens]|uniref:uncharacterized protein LOC141674944 n=1 Tax=Apium graveolens TaxID=4045 RepID=UPI003D791F94